MRPRFTAAQLARQERWRREEKYSLATTYNQHFDVVIHF